MNAVQIALSKGKKVAGITGYLKVSKACDRRCSCNNGQYELYILVMVIKQKVKCDSLTIVVQPVADKDRSLLFGEMEVNVSDLYDSKEAIEAERAKADQVSQRRDATRIFTSGGRGTAYDRGIQLRKLYNSLSNEQRRKLDERFAPELEEKGKKDIFSLSQYDQPYFANAIADELFGAEDEEDCDNDF